jgi:hypothetical protein
LSVAIPCAIQLANAAAVQNGMRGAGDRVQGIGCAKLTGSAVFEEQVIFLCLGQFGVLSSPTSWRGQDEEQIGQGSRELDAVGD